MKGRWLLLMEQLWAWLQSLSGGAATFIGSLTGSTIGLLALLFGALYNARLNRKRDDRLREVDTRGVATALQAELSGVCAALRINAEKLENENSDFLGPDITHQVRIFPQLIQKIQLLDVETIRAVVDAYSMIEQHTQSCVLLGCTVTALIPNRRMLAIPAAQTLNIAKINRHTVEEIEKAIRKLDNYPSAG